MKRELQQQLYDKYPKLFRQKNLSVRESCMCWGIDCGNGWYELIDTLCKAIQNYVDSSGIHQVEFSQIKEKFGTLRIYADHTDTLIDSMIVTAEQLSGTVCELCGDHRTGKAQNVGGWIKTICKECKVKL